ncbi:Homeobox-leucine zipper protein HAT2 [Hibiscus syriacus]|uniref:Homeobox-leucine zipper protein HAT2 n=1 Tax=Hibiscus syriacus TaxID=106335 RepID=A0A6A3AZW8_HIBSY|nr:Homeobox-leucine zipper protein HAT2 [Hibiscus syriacus]
MVGKEDLGSSLSLSFPQIHHSLQLNLKPSIVPSSANSCFSPSGLTLSKPLWNDYSSPSDHNSEAFRAKSGSFFRGIDMNILPSTAVCEEETGVSSPYSTISSVSGKRSERESNGDDLEIEKAYSRGISDEEDGDTSRKKLRLSKDQSAILEESFKVHNTLNPRQKLALAKQLGLRPRQVEVWFQNRRARTKLKQTEVDCEFLKRCCENLTEENRRLQKEGGGPTQPPSTIVDPRSHHLAKTQYRPIPFNPWAPTATVVAHIPSDALRPQS